MKYWLPEEIMDFDEFLSEDLKKIRDYAVRVRNEDFYLISIDLHCYEERVLFSFDLGLETIGWGEIVKYAHDYGEYPVRFYKEQRRKVKSHFLRGWLEDQLWDFSTAKQQELRPPENSGVSGLLHEKQNGFFYGESAEFSADTAGNYWKKYRSLSHRHRSERPRYINPALVSANTSVWYVFVPEELARHYYDRSVKIEYDLDFPPVGAMKTVTCAKKTDTEHAVIANYISWQELLRFYESSENGDTKMKPRDNCLERMKKLYYEASLEKYEVPPEVVRLLKKIGTEKRISELPSHEQEILCRAAESSPKIQRLFRMAQLEYIHLKTKDCQKSATRVNAGRYAVENPGAKSPSSRLIRWISPAWEPMWSGRTVTASEIPGQVHVFSGEDGDIRLSCHWEAPYKNDPAHIRLEWKADIGSTGELRVRFMNPETSAILSEFRLGTDLSGEEFFTAGQLGFDPSSVKWAVSLMILEPEP